MFLQIECRSSRLSISSHVDKPLSQSKLILNSLWWMIHSFTPKYFLGEVSRKKKKNMGTWHPFPLIYFSGKIGIGRLLQLIILFKLDKHFKFYSVIIMLGVVLISNVMKGDKRKCSNKTNWEACGFQHMHHGTMQNQNKTTLINTNRT